MLKLHHVRIELSIVRNNKGTSKYDKRTITCDIRIAQCEHGTVKYEEKNKGTTECDKRTITCDVGIEQCEDGTVKCEKK